MAQTIVLKRSAVAGKIPTFADLVPGELAINTYDGKIFLKKNDGSDSIVEFNGDIDVPVPAGAVNAVQLNAGDGSLDAVSMGTAGHVLTSNGADAPTWEPTTVGTVTSVNATGGTTGMTFTGGPITNAGSLTLGGTLNVASGGTGVSSVAELTDLVLPEQTGSNGKVLSTDGTAPQWIDLPAIPAGTVTSVGVSGGTTGLTTTGGPVTSSGSITMSGTLNVANGGTGVTSAGALRQVAVPAQTGNSGKVLSTDGTDTAWVSLPATTNGTVTSVGVSGGTTGLTTTGGPVTASGNITLGGTLAIANGGTGVTTQAALQEVALPAQTANAGKILSTNGTVASWIDAPTANGTVTSVGVSGGTTGLTTTGGPVTASGTITLGGMLAIANGGTGATTAAGAMNNISPTTTAGDMIIRGVSEHSRVPIGNVGDVLTVSGGSTVEWRPAGGALYLPVVENDVHAIPEGVTSVHMYRPQGGSDVGVCVVQFPPNAVDNQPFSLYFGIEINALLLASTESGVTISEQLNYVRDGETARWLYNAASSQWLCIENPRHMFVVTQGNIGTTGSDMILDVNNIRFTLKYRTGTSTQATAQTITGSEMIDLRWVSIYNGAIDASAYDGYTLTTTPVIVDSVIYDASNELPHIHLRENNRIWRIHFFASANGARTTLWAKRVV